jgi:hypothetical protein
MAEQDLQKRAELLYELGYTKIQLPENTLEELLQSENQDIRDTAFAVMKNTPSAKMRIYALTLLQSGEQVVDALSLLSKNITAKDEQLFCDAVKSIPVKLTEVDWHDVFMAAEDGVKHLRGKPQTDLLEYIYHQTYCGYCRGQIVRLMHKKNVLSDSRLQECLLDSRSDIRQFAKRVTAKR